MLLPQGYDLEKHQYFIANLLTLLLLLVFLKISGIIHIENIELLSYIFIFFGLSYAFNSFGKNRQGLLFTSTVIFLIGLILFIISKFEILQPSHLVLPALLLIIGIGFFIVWIDGEMKNQILVLSIIFLFSGIMMTILKGSITFRSFFVSLADMTVKYWPVLLIFAGVFLMYRKRNE